MSIHVPRPISLSYPVDDDSRITVRVVIGDAQGGGWAIDLDDKFLGKGADPDLMSVGTGGVIRGKELQVTASVLDIRPETSRLSATVVLEGGVQGKKAVPQSYNEGSEGDLAIFTTLVEFM